MKEPISELPWKVDSKYDDILTEDNRHVVSGLSIVRANAEYIVEAANNYPEAIRLLVAARGRLAELGCGEIAKGIREFLEKIEDGSKGE